MNDLMQGLASLSAAHDEYATAESYYTGEAMEKFGSAKLAAKLGRSTEIEHNFNFAKKPVNVAADRLEVVAVSSSDESQNAELQVIWDNNALGLELPIMMRNACKLGDAFIIVWPADDGTDEADAETVSPLALAADDDEPLTEAIGAPEPGRVDMFYNSPLTTRVFYDPEKPLRKSYAIKSWRYAEGLRADLYYPDRIEKYATKSKDLKGDEAAHWVEYVDNEGDGWPYHNPFGEVPVFHLRTDRPYGVPLHEGFYGPQDAITKLISAHLTAVDYQAGPQRYAMLEAETATDEFEDDEFEDDDADEGVAQFRSSPGSLWMMRGVKGVGQFDPAAPATFTDPMLVYLRMGAEITNTPLHRVDPTGDHPSGESLRTAEAPFVKMVRLLQMSFGTTLREAFEFALRVRHTPTGGTVASVDVRWAPAQSYDPAEKWEMAKAQREAGVPLHQVLLEAGYTAEQLEAWGVPANESDPAEQGE